MRMSGSPRPASNHDTSMSSHRARTGHLVQRSAVHFAGPRERELLDGVNRHRPLVTGEAALLEPAVEVVLAGVADDKCNRHLAEIGMRTPHDAGVAYRGV